MRFCLGISLLCKIARVEHVSTLAVKVDEMAGLEPVDGHGILRVFLAFRTAKKSFTSLN